MKPTESFLAAAADAGIAFESGELDQLGQYLALLVEANETTNLTRIVDPDDAWPRHILDALQLLALLGELPPEAKVLDVGSGGGIPAIPLALPLFGPICNSRCSRPRGRRPNSFRQRPRRWAWAM